MGVYFHGWHRKIGVGTLAITLLFLSGWIRSLFVNDRIEFSKFIQVVKKDKYLAGLATEHQSLVLLVYKVDEVECRPDEHAVSYSSGASQTGDVAIVGSIRVSEPMLTGTMPSVQRTEVSDPAAVVADQPSMLTKLVAEQQPAPPVNGTPMFTPLPASMLSNPGAEISIRTVSTQPLLSVLTAVSILPLVAVPFWSIVIPLTLISAYLLINVPRTSKLKLVDNAASSSITVTPMS